MHVFFDQVLLSDDLLTVWYVICYKWLDYVNEGYGYVLNTESVA